jgi:hypothetical protein
VEHGAHFLILYYPSQKQHNVSRGSCSNGKALL